jgi:mannose-6-phosphate isomerase-like protein (cupin superfamily)
MSSNLYCSKIAQDKFLEYDFDALEITEFSVINSVGEQSIYIPGETYLFPTYSAYGHSLMDVFAQFKVLQLKYKNVKPFFYEQSERGYFFNSRILSDQMSAIGYSDSQVHDISKGNYVFEKIVMFFDMNNTFPEDFYKKNGATRNSHYFPFCDCYQGTEPCGQSKYFKYNYLAIDMLKESFGHLFTNTKTDKLFISRERYNKKYQEQINFYSQKQNLSDEEKVIYHVAQTRSTPKESYIQELFENSGYKIVYAEDYTLAEQIKLFSSAKTIASISGTGLFNAFWCNEDTSVIEILAVPHYKYHYGEFAKYSGTKHTYVDVVNLSKEETIKKVEDAIFANRLVGLPEIDMQIVEQARAENRVHIFKNPFKNLPSLDTIMSMVSQYVDEDLQKFPERSYLLSDHIEGESSDMRLKCRFWSRMALQLFDPEDPYLSIIPELAPVTEWGLSQYPANVYDGNFCLVSLMKNRGVVGSKHRDYVDQFQWVVKGEMIWRTGENLENAYHVSEGDFIFVPKNLAHEVETVKAPRVAINLILRN